MCQLIKWETSWEAAVRIATKRRLPILIDFYTDWCTYCKQMDAETIPVSSVQQTLQKVVCLRLNSEQSGRALATKYGVSSLPTYLLVNTQGDIEGTLPGYRDAVRFNTDLSTLIRGFGQGAIKVKQAIAARNKEAAGNLLKDLLMKRQLKPALELVTGLDRQRQPFFSSKAYFTLGQLLLMDGNTKAARVYVGRGLELKVTGDERGAALFLTALTYYKEKNMVQVRKYLNDVIKNSGTDEKLIANAKAGLADLDKRK